MATLPDRIRELARAANIDIVGITRADPFPGYLWADSPRRDPRLSFASARSILLFGVYIGGFALPSWDDARVGRTSRLILSGFDLDIVTPLEPIVSFLRDLGFEAELCDDAKPGGSILPLKLAAVRAGIGWQGKNSLLVSQQFGSFLSMGGIVTNAELEPEGRPAADRCGKCRACMNACPTGAIEEPYRLNRERCLTYRLQRPSLPEDVRRVVGNRVLQCEICQGVCPWNQTHLRHPLDTRRTRQFWERVNDLTELFDLFRLFEWSEEQYQKAFVPFRTDTPYSVFRRNVVVALANSGHPDARSLLSCAAEGADPEIREIAQASLGQ